MNQCIAMLRNKGSVLKKEASEENQWGLKSMTDLRGVEVRNERTALIKTGDWSPDCGAAAFRMMGISTRPSIKPRPRKIPSFSQSLHRISSPLLVNCYTLLHFSIGDRR